jgi:hypothetical protein
VINRNATGQLLPLEKVTRDADGNIILIEEAYQNAGSRKARGADFGVSYQLETSFGTFTSLTQATFLDSLQFAQTSFEPELELVGNSFFDSNTAALQWKGNSRLDWTWRGFSLGATVYYLEGFHETTFRGETHYVSQSWLCDLRASYTFLFPPRSATTLAPKDKETVTASDSDSLNQARPIWTRLIEGTTISVGCNNVFDPDPPHAATGVNFPSALYDPAGRFVYFRVSKKF